jgi:glutamyl-tRNA reductase
LLIDLAVPRSFDPAINVVDSVYLYDVDDLESVIADNRGARASEAAKAETIVDGEVDAFWSWFGSLDVVPTIVALRARAESIRQREMDRHASALAALDERQREAVDRLTSAIVNKLLHGPLSTLKQRQDDPENSFAVEAARRLFQLGGPDDDDGES